MKETVFQKAREKDVKEILPINQMAGNSKIVTQLLHNFLFLMFRYRDRYRDRDAKNLKLKFRVRVRFRNRNANWSGSVMDTLRNSIRNSCT